MLKSNLVSHADPRANRAINIESLITHGSVIRAVADYTAKALQGSGRIIIGDCPIQSANWEKLIAQSVLNEVCAYLVHQTGQVLKQIREPKRYLAILDGLVGGSKESPLSPTPVQSGLMLASRNPIALDAVAAALMGFDISRIPQIMEVFSMKVMQLAEFTLEEIEIRGSLSASSIREIYQTKCFRSFQPSIGYKSYLEYPLRQSTS
jgi:uncharacterized protein (DUF362 family)